MFGNVTYLPTHGDVFHARPVDTVLNEDLGKEQCVNDTSIILACKYSLNLGIGWLIRAQVLKWELCWKYILFLFKEFHFS